MLGADARDCVSSLAGAWGAAAETRPRYEAGATVARGRPPCCPHGGSDLAGAGALRQPRGLLCATASPPSSTRRSNRRRSSCSAGLEPHHSSAAPGMPYLERAEDPEVALEHLGATVLEAVMRALRAQHGDSGGSPHSRRRRHEPKEKRHAPALSSDEVRDDRDDNRRARHEHRQRAPGRLPRYHEAVAHSAGTTQWTQPRIDSPGIRPVVRASSAAEPIPLVQPATESGFDWLSALIGARPCCASRCWPSSRARSAPRIAVASHLRARDTSTPFVAQSLRLGPPRSATRELNAPRPAVAGFKACPPR